MRTFRNQYIDKVPAFLECKPNFNEKLDLVSQSKTKINKILKNPAHRQVLEDLFCVVGTARVGVLDDVYRVILKILMAEARLPTVNKVTDISPAEAEMRIKLFLGEANI